MLEKIIELLKDENGYVSSIYEVTEYLYLNNASIQEINDVLKELIKHNNEINKSIENENTIHKKSLELIEKNQKNFSQIIANSKTEQKQNNISTQIDENDDEQEIDTSYYIAYIDELYTKEYEDSEIINNLPTSHNPDFLFIMNNLIAHYNFERSKVEELLNSDSSDMNDYINEELKLFDKLLNLLNQHKSSIDLEDEITEDNKKRILFNENVIMSDIDVFENTELSDLYLMFTSLENNTLKNVKRYTPIGVNKAINQIRVNTTRALFEKLDDDTFYVYYVFHKDDTDRYYHNKLVIRVKDFFRERDALIQPFYSTNPDDKEKYLDNKQTLYEEVIKRIKPKEKNIEVQ